MEHHLLNEIEHRAFNDNLPFIPGYLKNYYLINYYVLRFKLHFSHENCFYIPNISLDMGVII